MHLKGLIRPLFHCSILIVPYTFLQGQSLNRMLELGLHQSSATLTNRDSIENITLTVDKRELKLNGRKFYYWFGNGQIKVTQGNYSGRLLHGPYVLFSRNKDLLSKGEYRYGLKNGIWQNWYPDGTLKYVGHWKKGLQHGSYYDYFMSGRIRETGMYRNGNRHGTTFIYSPEGQVNKVRYRRGKLVKPASLPLPKDSVQRKIKESVPQAQKEVSVQPGGQAEEVQTSPEKSPKQRKSSKRIKKQQVEQ